MHHDNGENGNISFLISIFLGILSYIIGNIDMVLKISVAVASVAAGIMAVRYHYYATKEKKEEIKRNKIRYDKENV